MRTRHGFTLVELLVVIAIVGVLVGLLLPAVQAAREAARKSTCQNNLRQIGLALQSYHTSKKCLPIGCVEWRGPRGATHLKQFAWSAHILPQLEQQNLYDSINFDLPFDAPQNDQAAAIRLPVFECPSAPDAETERGVTHYGGLFGERILDRQPDDGIFLYDKRIDFDDIRDGLSSTIAVAEDIGGPDCEWINGNNVFVQSGAINDHQAWVGDNEIRGAHTGGAMALFADGHVQFLSEHIELKVVGALITRDGREVIDADSF